MSKILRGKREARNDFSEQKGAMWDYYQVTGVSLVKLREPR